MAGSFARSTELELNMFQPSPFGDLVCHLSTQVNTGLLSAYITIFDPRRDKRRFFIPYLVYALIYPSIASKLVTLDNLSPWSDYVCTYTSSPLSRKTLLR